MYRPDSHGGFGPKSNPMIAPVLDEYRVQSQCRGPTWADAKQTYLGSLLVRAVREPVHHENARQVLARFESHSGIQWLTELDDTRIEQYIESRKARPGRRGPTLSVASLNHELTYIRCFASFAAQRFRRQLPPDWDPPVATKLPRKKSLPRRLSSQEIERFFAACEHARRPAFEHIEPGDWWKTLCLVAMTTGLRRKELMQLPAPSRADLANLVLHVPPEIAKEHDEAVLPLHEKTAQAIRTLARPAGTKLFVWPFHFTSFYQELRTFQSDYGIPRGERIGMHQLRKHLGTTLASLGANQILTMQIMRHADIRTTAEHYISDLAPEGRSMIERIEIPDRALPSYGQKSMTILKPR